MVFEFTTELSPFFTFAERDTLRRTQRLPLPTFRATKVTFNTEANGRFLALDGYHAAVSVGHFVLQLTVVRTPVEMIGIWLPVRPKWERFLSYISPDVSQR